MHMQQAPTALCFASKGISDGKPDALLPFHPDPFAFLLCFFHARHAASRFGLSSSLSIAFYDLTRFNLCLQRAFWAASFYAVIPLFSLVTTKLRRPHEPYAPT